MRVAIIDCGTNTFNLLIAEVSGKKWKLIFEDKIPVKIGKGGIENKTITPEAFQRALHAMKSYALVLDAWKVDKTIATSTSAFRSTENGPQLRHEIFETCGIDVKIISGDQESLYIYKGVTLGMSPREDMNCLIMDIGGGSTEFILYSGKEILYKESFLLGASRLLEKFKPDDPLTNADIINLTQYFDALLKPTLLEACNQFPPEILIGSSGFFDTLRKISYYKFNWKDASSLEEVNYPIQLEEFNAWYNTMLPMNLEQRMQIKGMTSFRAEMMGVSMILVDYIIKNTGVQHLVNSKYALKEGVLASLLEK